MIVRPAGGGAGDRPLVATVHATYLPNRVLTVATEGEDLAGQRTLIPWVAEKAALRGAATA